MPYVAGYGWVCPNCGISCTCSGTGGRGGPAIDGGYAYYNGSRVYWDYHRDGNHKINIFPQGPDLRGHDHIILLGAEVLQMGGDYYIKGGREVFRRIDGVKIIDQ